ncbi:MAG: replicative DNA helicase [Bacteroidales bacterium]
MMLGRDGTALALNEIKADMFYAPAHRFVYEAIEACYKGGGGCDFILVTEQLRRRDPVMLEQIGGPSFIAHLSNCSLSLVNMPFHIALIRDKYLMRETIIRLGEALDRSRLPDADPETIAAELQKLTGFMMHQMYSDKEIYEMPEAMALSIAAYKERETKAQNGELPGISTGIGSLNRLSGGFSRGDLNIIASRPSMGKTALSLFMAQQTAQTGNRVLIVSLEMTVQQLGGRMLVGNSGICSESFRLGTLTPMEVTLMEHAGCELSGLPIAICDTPTMRTSAIRNLALNVKNRLGLDILFIDYMQLIDMRDNRPSANREQEMAATSRELKMMAKELDIAIVALSQLNRVNETRGNSEPQISNLRDSGAIEQDADMILLLHRNSYYDKDAPDKGYLKVLVKKHRQGSTADLYVKHNDSFTWFE